MVWARREFDPAVFLLPRIVFPLDESVNLQACEAAFHRRYAESARRNRGVSATHPERVAAEKTQALSPPDDLCRVVPDMAGLQGDSARSAMAPVRNAHSWVLFSCPLSSN